MVDREGYGALGGEHETPTLAPHGPAQAHLEPPSACGRETGYSYSIVNVAEAVRRAVAGEWDVPEFQRGFVWQPAQVCALADSLWRGYPSGALLLWNNAERAAPARQPQWWIADGQQRLTSLSLLFGREPAWLRRKPAEVRARTLARFDIRFDVEAASPPRFVAADPATAAVNAARLVPLKRLITLDPARDRDRIELERLAAELKRAGCGLDGAELYARLGRLCMMRRRELAVARVYHERGDVLEIFQRLSSGGMRFRRLVLKIAMEEIPAAIRGVRGWCQR